MAQIRVTIRYATPGVVDTGYWDPTCTDWAIELRLAAGQTRRFDFERGVEVGARGISGAHVDPRDLTRINAIARVRTLLRSLSESDCAAAIAGF